MLSAQLSRVRDFESRIKRASELGERYPAATEILTFYRRIAEFQRSIFNKLAPDKVAKAEAATPLREAIDIKSAVLHLPELLALVDAAGTPVLKETACELRSYSTPDANTLFEEFALDVDAEEAPDRFFARICLQPYAEALAVNSEVKPGFAGAVCPLCKGKPQLAVLKPEGDGGKRFLLCSFCITEWEFRRVLCPVCSEVDYQKLPRYSVEDAPAVRVEACDTCQHYLKSVDMTVEGRAAPIVDELATASLDLWARDRGYTKVHHNLLGF